MSQKVFSLYLSFYLFVKSLQSLTLSPLTTVEVLQEAAFQLNIHQKRPTWLWVFSFICSLQEKIRLQTASEKDHGQGWNDVGF